LEEVLHRTSAPIAHIGGVSSLSIKNTLNSAEEKKEETISIPKNQQNEAFSEEKAVNFWENYLDELKGKNAILYNALSTAACSVKDKSVIFFKFPSHSIYEEFESQREDFFQRLKLYLKNYSISFDYEIQATDKNVLLTSKEIYEKMVEINPLLKKLRNDFRLDIS
jgi:DNA polymerase-3 subunit gamma/tau